MRWLAAASPLGVLVLVPYLHAQDLGAENPELRSSLARDPGGHWVPETLANAKPLDLPKYAPIAPTSAGAMTSSLAAGMCGATRRFCPPSRRGAPIPLGARLSVEQFAPHSGRRAARIPLSNPVIRSTRNRRFHLPNQSPEEKVASSAAPFYRDRSSSRPHGGTLRT